LHRLGVRVTLLGRSGGIGFLSDPEALACARSVFGRELDIHPSSRVEHFVVGDSGVELSFHGADGLRSESFDCVIAATGRIPNVDQLGLENTSLERDVRGVPVHDTMSGQCGTSGIFIAGDATHRAPLLHEAADEGFAAGYNAAHFPQIRRFAQRAAIAVAFSDPQLMMVGESHAQLLQRGADFRIGFTDWTEQGRARVMGVNRGMLRVYGEADTGKFLGAEMVGPAAEHIAHLLAWARQSDLTVSQMLDRLSTIRCWRKACAPPCGCLITPSQWGRCRRRVASIVAPVPEGLSPSRAARHR
jgi:dihydrolipoamide dehydrogenase